MTREEASKILRDMLPGPIVPPVHPGSQKQETIQVALAALRGPTREMVERIFTGCDNCKPCCGTCESMYKWDRYGKPQECDGCKESGYKNYKSDSRFCECCGKPLTDEAVDMMLEKWKEAVDGE